MRARAHIHTHMQQHTHKYLSLTGRHSISVHCSFSAVFTTLSVFPRLFRPYLVTSFLSLSIHTSIFPSLFIPPTIGVFVMGQQKLFPCFFKPLGYLYWGVGGWEFLPESRTEGILCWTRERGRARRRGERGLGG